MMKLMRFSACLLLGVSMSGCAQERATDATDGALGTTTVATINGEPLYESVFRLYAMNRTQKSADELADDERALVLDELTQLFALAQEARKAGVDSERAIAAQIELQTVNTLARTQLNRYREGNAPSELELREEYEANLEELSRPQYKARHILVETEDKAKAIIVDLQGGADFAEQAKQHSTGPTGKNGGDLGWFDTATMVKPFGDAVMSMEKGTFTQTPVETRFGWHVILLEDVREGEEPGLEAVREQLTNSVMQRKMEAYVTGLKDAAAVSETSETAVE